jgi:hypothetical protein
MSRYANPGDLSVRFQDHEVERPRVVVIRITNTGKEAGLVQSRQIGALTCADAPVERLPSGFDSGPSRRQINQPVALTWAGAEC